VTESSTIVSMSLAAHAEKSIEERTLYRTSQIGEDAADVTLCGAAAKLIS